VAQEARRLIMNRPRISVVVASHNAKASIERCLAALAVHSQEDGLEIVAVDNSTDGTTEVIRSRFPGIKLLVEPSSALIPELWKVGIQQSTGDIVAITTAHFIPDKEWLSEVLKAHQAPVTAVGGAIENDLSARILDWAVYFCRYSPYMLPFREGFVPEIAGDNASYKRKYIDQCWHVWSDGFWEPSVHAELKKAGFRLWLSPSIVIRHKRSFSFPGFMKQRFQHGIQFGRERAARFSVSKRMLYIVLSPTIPFIFLARITRQVVTKHRHQARLLQAIPLLLLFLSAWALGELVGYLRGPRIK
jgi:glycosyltransferase involved in cell wall biosynthesis